MTRKKKLLLQKIWVMIGSIITLMLLIIVVAERQGGMAFADSGLEAAVSDHLGRDGRAVTRGNLLQITHLDASGYGIKSLAGLEKLSRLEKLDLSNNKIVDLSPLANLSRLTTLNLDRNELVDLKVANFGEIKDLKIRTLSMRHNFKRCEEGLKSSLTDISLIGELSELRVLDLRGNNIDDISCLEKLSNLEEINLRDNSLNSLEPLASLVNLNYLNIHSNREVNSIKPLQGLTNLQTLIMRNVPVGDEISYLADMQQLRKLNVRNCNLSNLDLLGEMMSEGLLQDNYDTGLRASLDIRENNVPWPTKEEDHYKKLRVYWENIDDRQPFYLPEARINPPVFSLDGGFYEDEFELTLITEDKDLRVFYTLDGSEPDPEKNSEHTLLYEEPIKITDRADMTNTISTINPGYDHTDWAGPAEKTFKGTVVRAIAVDQELYRSKVVTHSYFICKDLEDRYSLPVISISTAKDNLFGYEEGIYVAGKVYDDTESFWQTLNPDGRKHNQPANFHQRGRNILNLGGTTAERYGQGKVMIERPDHGMALNFDYLRDVPQVTIKGTEHYDGIYYLDSDTTEDQLLIVAPYIPEEFAPGATITRNWERLVSVEFFETDGELAFSQQLGLRIHGGGSRSYPQKHLRIYTRGDYDSSSILEYRLFPEADTTKFERFILRSTTERSGLDDVIGQLLMKEVHPDMAIQRYRPAVLFVNGEFWGLYSIRDRHDDRFLAYKYGIERNELVFIEGQDIIKAGEPGDEEHFLEMDNLIKRRNIADAEIYEQVKKMICIENYIAYMLTGIYLNYTDWGIDKHQHVWRYTGSNEEMEANSPFDGRWRWLPIDLDGIFARGGGPEREYLSEIVEGKYLLGDLLKNEQFKVQFINTFADMINTVFLEEYAVQMVDDLVGQIAVSVVEENVMRWGHLDSSEEWYEHIDDIRFFLKERPDIMRQHIKNYFGYEKVINLKVQTDFDRGYLQVNSIKIKPGTIGFENQNSWQGKYFSGIPVTIRAVPKPGYVFTGWEGLDGENEEIVIELNEDIILKAEFEDVDVE